MSLEADGCTYLRRLDLRFASHYDELDFKRSSERSVVLTGFIMSCTWVAIAQVLAFFSKDAADFDPSYRDPVSYWSTSSRILFAAALGVAVASFFRLYCGCCKFVNWEVVMASFSTVIISGFPWVQQWPSAKLYGEDPDAIWETDTKGQEGIMLLTIDAICTLVCLFLPIRMIVKWVPPVMGVLSYSSLAFVVGSPYPDHVLENIVTLLSLCVFALIGAWYNESVARENFLAQKQVKKTARELEVSQSNHSELLIEKTACETLLSMVCDATIWLSDDASTILKSDERFDMMTCTKMQGQSMSMCLPPDENDRFSDAFNRAHDVPTLIPTSIVPRMDSESHILVDCFIVRHQPEKNEAERASQPAYLLGFRITEQRMAAGSSSQSYNKLQALDILGGSCLEERVLDEASMQRSSVALTAETTSTGKIFKEIGAKSMRATHSGASNGEDEEPSEHFAAIVALGTREGWLLDAGNVELKTSEFLGVGSFGVVVAALMYGAKVAVKIPRVDGDRLHAASLRDVSNELRILRRVRHPNIITFFGACIDARSQEICLVLEQIKGQALGKYVKLLTDGAHVALRRQLSLDIASALQYLHAQYPQIVHGDLKDSNILVDAFSFRTCLLDFGLSRILTKRAKPAGGTLRWMAPEVAVLSKLKPRTSADVFSFGRLVYMVFSGKQPLEGCSKETLLELAKVGRTMPLVWPEGMPLKSACWSLCERTAKREALERPSMQELVKEISDWHITASDIDLRDVPAPRVLSRDDSTPRSSTAEREQGISGMREALQLSSATEHETQSEPLGLALPNRQPTSSSAKLLMLTMQAMHWNFQVSRESCCLWHAAIDDMHSAVQQLWRMSCKPSFLPHTKHQCRRCGSLDLQRNCSICSVVAEGTPVRSSILGTIREERANHFSL